MCREHKIKEGPLMAPGNAEKANECGQCMFYETLACDWSDRGASGMNGTMFFEKIADFCFWIWIANFCFLKAIMNILETI